MRHFNDGKVFTNDKCIGCNKCISVCPVDGANVSDICDGKTAIKVASDKCIQCGKCIPACQRKAREYYDDTEAFFEALKSGRKISVLIDPVFYFQYLEEASGVLGYLRSMGVDRIYDVGYGAEISTWCHATYIRQNKDNPFRAYIGNNCPAMLSYIKRYCPDLLPVMIPYQSPVACTVIMAQKYEKDENELAYIGPCTAYKNLMDSEEIKIEYHVGISDLMSRLSGVELRKYEGKADCSSEGIMGSLISMEGGFKSILERYVPFEAVLVYHDTINSKYLKQLSAGAATGEGRPNFMDFVSCKDGCINGCAIDSQREYRKINSNILALKKFLNQNYESDFSQEQCYKELCERMSEFDLRDFYCEYVSEYKQQNVVPSSAYERIFKAMHKDTPEKRCIDCGSCGYETCVEMAKAIAYGYNKKENCIRYMNDELIVRYYTDPLTKINNKEGFVESVKRLYHDNPDKTYIIAVIALNQLNVINDIYGFMAGDKVILKASHIAENFVGETGGICGRLGGGEFLLCFENTRDNLDRIHNAGTYSFEDINVSFPLSFRAGLFIDKDRVDAIDTMINYASLARDRIEEDGISTCLFYNDELRERLAAEAMVTSQMYRALENHEFVSYFQPQYSHKTQQIVGAETLCRWVKKDGSIISPGLFIPIFEKNGFIKALDRYMWEEAFKAVLEWTAKGAKPIPISVNISRVSLEEAGFVESIKTLFEKYPIDPKLLHFEITESAYSARQDMVAFKINSLRDVGFMVAMDDFGSGYSSLNVLKDMPLDILKLDMGFLRGRNQEKGESIIRNVVAMIKELDLDIVSEGVETVEQAEFLRHVGCDVIQGYLYSRPMPKEDYEHLIMNY